MVLDMKETGKMICSMGLGRKSGLMDQSTRENTKKERSTEEESINGQMAQLMMEIGSTIK